MPGRREIEMTQPDFATRGGWFKFSAAMAAGIVATTLFSAVVLLFQNRGAPMEQWLAAERACAQYHYRSERETCMQQWAARSRATAVAAK